ncbi:efflux RND transporter periplasmic adaptor subunit [Fundidesulfovibrio agrisoli]|uniref:efflux RND transporter periplasmic adaptor subunit n=1 Tax=Fundidesulfovibrio agrisoli TaxID=2922717 RepID=UPI001FAE2548|nr:efflux RND transporter periplasmic adaptor subunit [Fundidesulfovibrio agrisoli]
MLIRTIIHAALAALLLAAPAAAETITFQGKTFSPNGYDLGTPHASEADLKAFEAEAKAQSAKKKDDEEETLVRPFTGSIKIIKVLVNIGDTVVPEQPLIEYSLPLSVVESELHRLSSYDLRMLDTQVERLQISLDKRNADYKEIRMRAERGLASDQEMTDARREIDLARMKLEINRQLYKAEKDQHQVFEEIFASKFGKVNPKAQKHLTFTGKIQAPDAGVVLAINPAIMPGMEINKPTYVMRIGPIDPLIIRALVHESLVVKLREGDKAKVSFDVLPGKTFEAVMSRVGISSAQSDPQFPSHYEVQLTLPNPDKSLREGMRGNVTVEVPDTPRS